ncbi:MAG: S8 family peptidase [Methylobacter sp.]
MNNSAFFSRITPPRILFATFLLVAISTLTVTPITCRADISQDSQRDPKLVPAEVSFEGPEVASDIIKFYRYLAKNNLLPTRDYTVPSLPKGQWLADVLLSEGIIVRGRPGSELTYLLCDLNPDNCEQTGNSNEPVFTYHIGRTIKVPNLPLVSYEYHKALPAKTAVSELKEKAIVFGISQDNLSSITSSSSTDDKSETLLVKATGYGVRLDLPEHDLIDENSDLRVLSASSAGMFVSRERPAKTYEDLNNGLDSIQLPSAISTTNCTPQSIDCESDLGSITKYDATNVLHRNNNSVIVGVIDGGLDQAHFDFKEFNEQRNIFENIDTNTGAKQEDIKHGTAVVGILAARKNGQGIIGLNPKATVAFYSSLNETLIPSKLDRAVDDRVHIFNMSVGYKTQQGQVKADKFAIRMQELGRRFLIVAAAGNADMGEKASNLDDDCGLRIPTCLYLQSNLLNVAALDQAERFILPTSNYGRNVIHIAARGEDIITDMPDGKIGVFNDTSAATAIVSGAAAIIKQLNPNLEPDIIAQRLQYTADFLDAEQDKKLISGRLNLRRAVEHINDDTLIKVDDKSNTICGTFKPATSYAKIRFFFEGENENNDRHEISVNALRRVSKIDNGKYTIMGMYSDAPAKPKRLTKWSFVTFIPEGSSESLPTDKQILFVKRPCSDEQASAQLTKNNKGESLDLNDIQELALRAEP